jgi:hypothetical protein
MTGGRPAARDGVRRPAQLLLAASAAYGIAYVAMAMGRGWPRGFGDAFALWSWGRFVAAHPAAAIYDPVRLHAAQVALGLAAGASYPFAYPPTFLLLLWPLGEMRGPAAAAVLLAGSLGLYLWATVGRDWRSPALLAAIAAPTTAIEIGSGQTGFLAAALLAGGLRLVATRPATAGVLFGLLTYKPQLGLLVPVALVAARQWRAIGAASLTALALGLAATAAFGTAIWPAWLAALPAFSQRFAAENGAVLHLMPTVSAALLLAGVPSGAAQAAQAAVGLAAAAAVWALFRRGPRPLAGAGLLVAALLATPYAFVYDMPIVATAVIWLAIERQRAGASPAPGEFAVMVLAMAAPLALVAGPAGPAVAALSLVLLLAAIARRPHPARAGLVVGRRS